MKKYFKIIFVSAALFICAVMCSCGNKSDMELPLDLGEQVETEGSSEDAAAGAVLTESGTDGASTETDSSADSKEETDKTTVFVHICGAVRTPDVYEVKPDARIIDVVKLAGGFMDEADSDYLNLAGGVTDGQKIYVPTEQEVADGLVPPMEYNAVAETGAVSADGAIGESLTEAGGISASGKVNINTANEEELKTLDGIGDKRAKDIIDYRNSNGNFKSIEDIKRVNGIKDGIYSKICDSIEV